MNGVPEAIGAGVTKLVDINPAIGMLVGALFIALVAVTKWGLDGWKAYRDAKQDHLDYVEAIVVEAKKDQEMYDEYLRGQRQQPARRRP